MTAELAWDQERWVAILDRIEHRRADVGLRFCGPPLWLEVTMVGSDSDRWPTTGEPPTSWDWQSGAPCVEVAGLAAEGADDDRLLAVVARYTIENLILNAVHEIGEWFRFDGTRVFPAHTAGVAALSDGDPQGNGAVTVRFDVGRAADGAGADAAASVPDQRLLDRLTEIAAASRFTYLPDTTISYEAAGPVIRRWIEGEPPAVWRSAWSTSTSAAADAGHADAVALIARDVHGALVAHEADRICRAFHLDGRRPWRLAVADAALGPDAPDPDTDAELLSIAIDVTPAR